MTASPTSVILAAAICAASTLLVALWRRRARRLKRQAAPATPANAPDLESLAPPELSVHDKPTIEFSAFMEQLSMEAENDAREDAPTRAFAAFRDEEPFGEEKTVAYSFDTVERPQRPVSEIVPLLRDAAPTRELSSVRIDGAMTGLPRPSVQTRARMRELVIEVPERKRQA